MTEVVTMLVKRIIALTREALSFDSGDYIAVDSEAAGSRKMSKDNLLNETAQNALAGNVAPAFDSTRTSENQYIIGQSCMYGGVAYTFINNHYGVWSSSDVVVSDETDRTPLSVGKSFSIVGKNLTVQYKAFLCEGVKTIKVVPSPNPWPKDTIGGTNPSILVIYAIKANGVSSILKDYGINNTIPSEIIVDLPDGTKYLKFFIRANSGSEVKFDVYNEDVVSLKEQNEIVDNLVLDFGKEFDDTENYKIGEKLTKKGALYRAIYPHAGSWDNSHFVSGNVFYLQDFEGSKKISFVGAGLTSKALYMFLSTPVEKMVVTHDPDTWPIDTIGGSNPSVFLIYAIASDGTETRVAYSSTSTPPKSRIDIELPAGTKALRFFCRANAGVLVNIFIDEYEQYTERHTQFVPYDKAKQIKSLSKSYGKDLNKFVLMGDPHASSVAFKAYKQLLSEYTFDGIVVLGDICPSSPTGATAYDAWNAFVSSVSTLILPVIGNHDVGQGASIWDYVPLSKSVENVMGPCVDKGDISTTYGYYYKDVGDIRFIVVNDYNIDGVYDADSKWERVAYDSSKPQIAFSTAYSQNDVVNVGVWTDYSYKAKENVTTPASNPTSPVHTFPCWSTRPDIAKVDAVQAQWVLDTMLATPSNKGIVIVKHSTLSTDFFIDSKSKFSQKYNADPGRAYCGDFYVDAVDAYNQGISFSAVVEGVSVSANFALKNNSVFVGFVSGHQHMDLVLRSTNKPKYYDVCVNMTTPSYFGWANDVWVNSGDASATIAAFDRYRKSTNLMKVGVDLTCDGYKRDNERIEQDYTG